MWRLGVGAPGDAAGFGLLVEAALLDAACGEAEAEGDEEGGVVPVAPGGVIAVREGFDYFDKVDSVNDAFIAPPFFKP